MSSMGAMNKKNLPEDFRLGPLGPTGFNEEKKVKIPSFSQIARLRTFLNTYFL